jgi:GT2 family glycosyltransferase
MPKVSVIIVSFNTKELIEKCLRSIKGPWEIIVVDNASTDGSAEIIKKKYPNVTLIESKTNLGFARANNLAMKKASGEYFLLLNSDAFLQDDTIINCLKTKADVVGCKLTYPDGRFQPSAGELPNPLNMTMWLLGMSNSYHPKSIKSGPKGWITGAFMFIKREVYETTGGFDEKIFMYGEEVEWCKRITDAGYKIWYTSEFSIVHIQGGSGGQALVKEMQGIKYYFSKHHPQYLDLIKFLILLGSIMRLIAFTMLGNKSRQLAYKQILTGL